MCGYRLAIGKVRYAETINCFSQVRQVSVQLLFSTIFALSCTMFELIIFEILDILARRYESQ
jgi:hypothetical protein